VIAQGSVTAKDGLTSAVFQKALEKCTEALGYLDTGRTPPVLVQGLTVSGRFIGNVESCKKQICDALLASKRLFKVGNTLRVLWDGADICSGSRLVTIAVEEEVAATAPAILSNVVMCQSRKKNSATAGDPDQPEFVTTVFAVPREILRIVVSTDKFTKRVSAIEALFSHPVLSRDFKWLNSGYYAADKIMVLADPVDPFEITPPEVPSADAVSVTDVLTRLPDVLRLMLQDFQWSGPIDLINFVGVSMMQIIMPVLANAGHPAVMIWANQPGVGKTLLAVILGILKDGRQPSPTSLDGGARELENQIASELNDGRGMIFVDNQKGVTSNATVEAAITAKECGYRAFHQQRKVRFANNILWVFTSNDAMPSEDLISRCVHVRLYAEGAPESRDFQQTEQELLEFVQTNRLNILAALGGMILAWRDAGSPLDHARCRFGEFGAIVGSVLAYWGLRGFVSNAGDEAHQHSEKIQQLTAIAERLFESRPAGYVIEVDSLDAAEKVFADGPRPASAMEAKHWVQKLIEVGALPASCDTDQKQKVAATRFLSTVLHLPVSVFVGDALQRGVMLKRSLGSRRFAYVFAIERPAISAVPEDCDGVSGSSGTSPQS
jgi:hypothetical protein